MLPIKKAKLNCVHQTQYKDEDREKSNNSLCAWLCELEITMIKKTIAR